MKATRTDKLLGVLILILFIVGLQFDTRAPRNAPQKSQAPRQAVLYSATPVYTSFPKYRVEEPPTPTKKPVKKVIKKVAVKASRGSQVRYYTVTAYCNCTTCTPGTGITASGKTAKVGMCAANLPFGTEIIIKGKKYVVEDRLSERYKNRIDLYINSHNSALEWGKQVLKVEILE